MTVESIMQQEQINLSKLIGYGYDEFMSSTKRYQLIKGSRASKKSYSVAYKIIMSMIHFKTLNVLVVRKVYGTLKDSCFALLKKVVYLLGFEDFFTFKQSPLEITYIPHGTQILFRGLDEPEKLSSINATVGILAWAWIEEIYQLRTLREFQLVDQCIRGEVKEPGLYKCIIGTFNPWLKSHFLRTEFFETEEGRPLNRPDTLAMTTNYLINEWLDDKDREFFETMRERNPQLYQVAGLGNWGNPEGLIFQNWEEQDFDIDELARRPGMKALFGCDFGFATDPTAFVYSLVDERTKTVWVCDDSIYASGLTSSMLADLIKEKGYHRETIVCDSAQPKDIWELSNQYDISGAIPCYKYAGSVLSRIRFAQDFKIIIHPKCINFLTEIQSYSWYVDREGRTLEKPAPYSLDHALDAWMYSLEGVGMGNGAYLGEAGGDQSDRKDTSKPPTEKETDKENMEEVETSGQTLCIDIGGSDDYDEDDDDSPMTVERMEREKRKKQQKDEGEDLFFEL